MARWSAWAKKKPGVCVCGGEACGAVGALGDRTHSAKPTNAQCVHLRAGSSGAGGGWVGEGHVRLLPPPHCAVAYAVLIAPHEALCSMSMLHGSPPSLFPARRSASPPSPPSTPSKQASKQASTWLMVVSVSAMSWRVKATSAAPSLRHLKAPA